MLTKDLLRYRRQAQSIKPQFIDETDETLLQLAHSLLDVFNNNPGATRADIEEQALLIIQGAKDLKLAKGLYKLLLDKAEFSSPTEFDYPTLRDTIFLKSTQCIQKSPSSLQEFRENVANGLNDEIKCFLEDHLYGDLEENDTLIKFKTLFPSELLQRYNVSLVQSLLLYSNEIDLVIEDPDQGKMRKMFKYLRFFRLLAQINSSGTRFKGRGAKKTTTPYRLHLTINGPITLFENTNKYGLQLASFFPAVCDFEKWKLSTTIKLKGELLKLNISQKNKLVGHYRNFSAYIPEEIRLFHKLFKRDVLEWEVVGGHFIHATKGILIFPDLSFQSQDGTVKHLELFHRWHATQLLQRLEQSAELKDTLLIGVDRFLYNKPEIKDILDNSKWFAEKGFLFRDFPTVSKVKKLLK